MFKLISRFAWLLSIIFWFLFVTYIWFLLWMREEEFFWFSIFFVPISALLFKKLFLSENLLKTRLRFFADKIKEEMTLDLEIKWHINIDEKILKDEKQKNQTLKTEEFKQNQQIKEEGDFEVVWLENNDYKTKKIIWEKEEEKEADELDIKNESYNDEPSQIELFFTRSWDSIKNFFSENLLAKIWWFIIFLWVVFLLFTLYVNIWPVWKIIVGFAIWFWIYSIWVFLDKKWFVWESRILLWIWILINYLVILWWRYLIWNNYDLWNTIPVWFFSDWLAFLFLILNTALAIITSLLYKSKTLLIFSFAFAYLNPFLVWPSDTNPYLILWYSLAVSFWWLYLWIIQKVNILVYLSFVFWNILFLFAPFSTDIWWIAKLFSSAILWVVSLFSIYKYSDDKENKLKYLFIANYIFLIFLIINWSDYLIIKETTSFLAYILYIILIFWFSVFLFLKTSIKSILIVLLFPIFIILWLSFNSGIEFVSFALSIITIMYLVWFLFIEINLSHIHKYIFFWVLAFFIFSLNLTNNFYVKDLSLISFISIIATSFISIITAYYFSKKEKLEFLYSIWTLWWVFILAPLIVVKPISRFIVDWNPELIPNWNLVVIISLLSMWAFAILNWWLPFFNSNLTNKNSNLKNLIMWSIIWVLFIWVELFRYWDAYFPGVSLWLTFLCLAIVYFMIWFAMYNKLWLSETKKEKPTMDTILSYLAISISIFSFAIALVFSNNKEIISSVWLFEATILFYFYSRIKDIKIYVWWIILFLIWVFSLWWLIDEVSRWEFIFLISFALISASFVLNLKFLNSKEFLKEKVAHDILHIIWIFILWSLLAKIIPDTLHWWSIFWISIFITCLSYIYILFASNFLKGFFVFIYICFMFFHVWEITSLLNRLKREDLEYLKWFQYISTIFLWFVVFLWHKFDKQKIVNNFIKISFSIYLLIIVSIYIYDIFSSTFAITMFWWVVASILLFNWIQKDIQKFRTVGLYLVILVSIKIFLFDIWYTADNAIIRVFAFMLIWALYIAVSLLYTRKYWNNLKKELNIWNVINGKNNEPEVILEPKIKDLDEDIKNLYEDDEEKEKPKDTQNLDEQEFVINKKIKEIDVSSYSSIKFIFNNWKTVSIKTVNLIKLAFIIIKKTWKSFFDAWELEKDYKFIIKNYKSELTKQNYERIKEVMKEFVKVWGEVRLIKK